MRVLPCTDNVQIDAIQRRSRGRCYITGERNLPRSVLDTSGATRPEALRVVPTAISLAERAAHCQVSSFV